MLCMYSMETEKPSVLTTLTSSTAAVLFCSESFSVKKLRKLAYDNPSAVQ